MSPSSLLGNARALLLGPLAHRVYVHVEGARIEGDRDSPVVKLYVWVEMTSHTPLLDDLRVRINRPFSEIVSLEVRERRHEEQVVSFPIDTGAISPKLTVLAKLGRSLPAVRGVVEGRVAATAGPGWFMRWSPFRAAYRWGAPDAGEAIEPPAVDAELEATGSEEAAL